MEGEPAGADKGFPSSVCPEAECGRQYWRLFDDDRHFHVAVPQTAVVIADCLECPRELWGHCNFCRFPRHNIVVDFQRPEQKTVSPISARQLQRDRLTPLQCDLAGAE